MPVNAPVMSTTDCDLHANEKNLVQQITPGDFEGQQGNQGLFGQQGEPSQTGKGFDHALFGGQNHCRVQNIKLASGLTSTGFCVRQHCDLA